MSLQALGMKLVKKVDRPEYKVNSTWIMLFSLLSRGYESYPLAVEEAYLNSLIFVAFSWQYSIAMMGYAEEHETTVLELTYNYGVTEYTKGNAYAQVSFRLLFYFTILATKVSVVFS